MSPPRETPTRATPNTPSMMAKVTRLEIPGHLTKKVPLHWHQFYDDVIGEFSQVTSEIYDGGVSKGLKNGTGKVILPTGEAFKGNWKNDLRHGTGVCLFPNGSIYKGEWQRGRPVRSRQTVQPAK